MAYEDNVEIWKKAYSEILKATDSYKNFSERYGFSDINDIRISAKNHLLLIEWYEKYGLKISHNNKPAQYNYFQYGDYSYFSYFGDAESDREQGSGKYISWPDDGRQPKNEWLFKISFPTGAYIFGRDYDYQQDLFKDFIKEIKGYNPDYSDTMNKSFYWELGNAKLIYNEFNNILKKYKERNASEFKSRKADKLRKELEALEGSKEVK